jgi:hypothetical protein
VIGGGELVTLWHYGIEGRLPPMTVIHVRYEILDDASRPHPDSVTDAYPWGVRAIGLPGNLSAHGVGDTLDSALADLSEGIRAALGDGPVPDELTREIAVTVEDAA